MNNMRQYKYRFSVFTATYNRGNLLPVLYQSLINQTYNGSFEWVIVSDGSTDDTSKIVSGFIRENKIPIQYIEYQINKGKYEAWRKATEVFEGRYVVTADDDDPISLDYLSVFDKYWRDLEKQSSYDLFWEIRARAQYEDGQLVGEKLPLPYFDSDYIEVHYKMHKGAEMVGCRKIEVLRNEAAIPDHFIFEEKASNYSECLRWSKAARKYKTRFVPDIVRTYTRGHDSLTTTLKGMKPSSRKCYNSLVETICSLNLLGNILRKYDRKRYLLTVLIASYYSIITKEKIVPYLRKTSDKVLVCIAYIPAFIIYLIRYH